MEKKRITIEEVLELYAAGERNFPEVAFIGRTRKSLEGIDLSGINLRNADLSTYGPGDLSGINFSGADLSRADFTEDLIEYANLSGANLSGASFYQAGLYGADLRGANLSGADLRFADLRCTKLDGANLSGTNMLGTHLYGVKLTNVNLKGAIEPFFVMVIFDNTIMPDGSIRSN